MTKTSVYMSLIWNNPFLYLLKWNIVRIFFKAPWGFILIFSKKAKVSVIFFSWNVNASFNPVLINPYNISTSLGPFITSSVTHCFTLVYFYIYNYICIMYIYICMYQASWSNHMFFMYVLENSQKLDGSVHCLGRNSK